MKYKFRLISRSLLKPIIFKRQIKLDFDIFILKKKHFSSDNYSGLDSNWPYFKINNF